MRAKRTTILSLFDRAGEVKLVRPTFLDDEPHGVFASRHPCRPNSLGLTVVRLISRVKNLLEVSGVDVLDKTPVIDIKPYIPRFDCFPEANEGWVASKKKGRNHLNGNRLKADFWRLFVEESSYSLDI